MEETLRQLGELLLGAIPTVVLFLVLFASYRVLLHAPLVRVLAERRSRTEGALEKAKADIAAAEARTAEYEQHLREARINIFKAQEQQRQQALQARAMAIAEARAAAEVQVKEAKLALATDMAESKIRLSTEAERLASLIVDNLLHPVEAAHPVGGGQ